MVTIKNVSLQGLVITINTNYGPKEHWLHPGSFVTLQESFLTESIKTLQRRKMIKVVKA